jgi:hypothetical protein
MSQRAYFHRNTPVLRRCYIASVPQRPPGIHQRHKQFRPGMVRRASLTISALTHEDRGGIVLPWATGSSSPRQMPGPCAEPRRLRPQMALRHRLDIGTSMHTLWALRRNSWKSTPIEGVAGNLVIQQERPPSETVAKSPSIRLFRAFVCPPGCSDLRPPPTSGRGRFGHVLHLVGCSHPNPGRKESAYRASSDQASEAPAPALIVHR